MATVNFGGLYKLYAYAIGYMVAVIVALHVIAAMAQYVTPLAVIVIVFIVARLVWSYTRW